MSIFGVRETYETDTHTAVHKGLLTQYERDAQLATLERQRLTEYCAPLTSHLTGTLQQQLQWMAQQLRERDEEVSNLQTTITALRKASKPLPEIHEKLVYVNIIDEKELNSVKEQLKVVQNLLTEAQTNQNQCKAELESCHDNLARSTTAEAYASGKITNLQERLTSFLEHLDGCTEQLKNKSDTYNAETQKLKDELKASKQELNLIRAQLEKTKTEKKECEDLKLIAEASKESALSKVEELKKLNEAILARKRKDEEEWRAAVAQWLRAKQTWLETIKEHGIQTSKDLMETFIPRLVTVTNGRVELASDDQEVLVHFYKQIELGLNHIVSSLTKVVETIAENKGATKTYPS